LLEPGKDVLDLEQIGEVGAAWTRTTSSGGAAPRFIRVTFSTNPSPTIRRRTRDRQGAREIVPVGGDRKNWAKSYSMLSVDRAAGPVRHGER